MSNPSAQAAYEPRRATRDLREPIIGGVASGLARHLGLPVLWIRVGFVVTARTGRHGHRVLRRALAAAAGRRPVRDRRARPRERHAGRSPAGSDPPADRHRPDRRARGAGHRPRLHAGGAVRPGCADLADRDRARRHRPALAAGRRGAARALARRHRPDQPGASDPGRRRVGVVRPARRRRRPDHPGAVAVRAAQRLPVARPGRHVRGAGRRRRHRHRRRAVDLPARHRADRRARGAGPHPGARRRRRPPARLGAADPRADPEELRRRHDGRPARARPGA